MGGPYLQVIQGAATGLSLSLTTPCVWMLLVACEGIASDLGLWGGFCQDFSQLTSHDLTSMWKKKDTYSPNVQFLLEFVLYAIANLTHSCLTVPEEIVFGIFDKKIFKMVSDFA